MEKTFTHGLTYLFDLPYHISHEQLSMNDTYLPKYKVVADKSGSLRTMIIIRFEKIYHFEAIAESVDPGFQQSTPASPRSSTPKTRLINKYLRLVTQCVYYRTIIKDFHLEIKRHKEHDLFVT